MDELLCCVLLLLFVFFFFFFFNDTATTEIYTLSLHDALPILILLAEFLQGAEFQNNRSVIKAWTPHLSSALGISSLKLHCVFSHTQTAVWVWVWVVNISMPLRVELLNNYATVTVPIG